MKTYPQTETVDLITNFYTYEMSVKNLSDFLTDHNIENVYNDNYPKSLTIAIDSHTRPLTVIACPSIGSRVEFFVPIDKFSSYRIFGPWCVDPNPKTVKQITLDMGESEDPTEWSIVYKCKGCGRNEFSMYYALAFRDVIITSYFHPSISKPETYLEETKAMYKRHAIDYRQKIADGKFVIVD